MQLIRLKNTTDNYFSKAWNIYQEAFPFDERRLLAVQTQVMKNPAYHFDIVMEEQQLIGIILWWDFDAYRYIDHFATATAHRNKGYGKLILEKFKGDNKKSILLEVELPDTAINKRRIKFYERLGFKLNMHHYKAPALSAQQSPLEFLLMSYPNAISSNDVAQFVAECHPIIFGK